MPLRQAFAELNLGAALTIIRTAPGLSQLEFANLLGWSQSAVARAESGDRGSLYDIRRLLEVVDALGMPREALIRLVLGKSGEKQIESEVRDEMGMSRRQVSSGLVGLVTAASLRQIRIPSKVDSVHVRYLHLSAEKLWAKDQSVGGGALTRDGLRLYRRACRMLDEADYGEEVRDSLSRSPGHGAN